MRHDPSARIIRSSDRGACPPEVLRLSPRMRAIATVVYETGGATVTDVQAGIPDPPSIYGIRTLLNRMAARGIVKRRRSGRHTEMLYLPGILTEEVRSSVLRTFVEDNFDGSLLAALQEVLRVRGQEKSDLMAQGVRLSADNDLAGQLQ